MPKRVPPTVILLVLAGILLFCVAKVVPQFEEGFRGLPGGIEGLPAATRVMMYLSAWLVDWWWAVVGCFVALVFIEIKRFGAKRSAQ